jgi:hypothetical protein
MKKIINSILVIVFLMMMNTVENKIDFVLDKKNKKHKELRLNDDGFIGYSFNKYMLNIDYNNTKKDFIEISYNSLIESKKQFVIKSLERYENQHRINMLDFNIYFQPDYYIKNNELFLQYDDDIIDVNSEDDEYNKEDYKKIILKQKQEIKTLTDELNLLKSSKLKDIEINSSSSVLNTLSTSIQSLSIKKITKEKNLLQRQNNLLKKQLDDIINVREEEKKYYKVKQHPKNVAIKSIHKIHTNNNVVYVYDNYLCNYLSDSINYIKDRYTEIISILNKKVLYIDQIEKDKEVLQNLFDESQKEQHLHNERFINVCSTYCNVQDVLIDEVENKFEHISKLNDMINNKDVYISKQRNNINLLKNSLIEKDNIIKNINTDSYNYKNNKGLNKDIVLNVISKYNGRHLNYRIKELLINNIDDIIIGKKVKGVGKKTLEKLYNEINVYNKRDDVENINVINMLSNVIRNII